MLKNWNFFLKEKNCKTCLEEAPKPELKVRTTVVPESFDGRVTWDRHKYDNITVFKDK